MGIGSWPGQVQGHLEEVRVCVGTPELLPRQQLRQPGFPQCTLVLGHLIRVAQSNQPWSLPQGEGGGLPSATRARFVGVAPIVRLGFYHEVVWAAMVRLPVEGT